MQIKLLMYKYSNVVSFFYLNSCFINAFIRIIYSALIRKAAPSERLKKLIIKGIYFFTILKAVTSPFTCAFTK